jgi:Type IV secretion system pilin
MNTIKRVFAITSFSALLGFFGVGTLVAFAQTTPPPAPITNATGLVGLFCSIISWFIVILLAISVIMVLVAAFDYVTAGDDAEKTTRGRRRLTYAAVGIAVVLIAYGFPQIIATIFPSNPSVSAFSCGAGSSGSSAPYGPNSD